MVDIILIIIALLCILYAFGQYAEESNKKRELNDRKFFNCKNDFEEFIAKNFKIIPCGTCADVNYFLLDINSVGTSIQLGCNNCKRKKWFKDIKVDQSIYDKNKLISLWNNFQSLSTEQEREPTEKNLVRFNIDNINMNDPSQNISDEKRSRHIPQKVRDKVWNRDGGKCVQCGSNEDLEYDHIIPHSKGGANTYRNIQLLCESCNRKKSAKIG